MQGDPDIQEKIIGQFTLQNFEKLLEFNFLIKNIYLNRFSANVSA